MKHRLKEEVLQTIVMDASEVVWVKPKKEIRAGDHLFDVESWYIDEQNKAWFTGLYDFEERSIEKKLNALNGTSPDKSVPENKNSGEKIWNYLKLIFHNSNSGNSYPTSLTTRYFLFDEISSYNHHRVPPTPPPKWVSGLS